MTTTYQVVYLFKAGNSDGRPDDIMFSPVKEPIVLPEGFDRYALAGTVKADHNARGRFTGDGFMYDTPVQDVSVAVGNKLIGGPQGTES